MTEAATDRATAAPRWGLPDAFGGWVAIQLWAQIFAGVVLVLAGYEGTDFDDLPLGVVAVAQAGLALGMFAVPALAARLKGRSLREDFGFWFEWRDVPLGLISGIGLQLLVLPLLYWPILEILDRSSSELDDPARSLSDRADSAVGVVLLLLIVGVLAPVFEELFYRGLMQRAFLKRGFPGWAAVLVTAVVFAGAHLQALQLPGLLLAGVVFGALAQRSGRLGPAITCHMGFNLAAIAGLLAS